MRRGGITHFGSTARRLTRVDPVNQTSTRSDQARALWDGVITARIYCAKTHRDRRIAIQRSEINAFYNTYREIDSGASLGNLTTTTFS